MGHPCWTLLALLAAARGPASVTLVGFSDYHSHALPFYSEGVPGQGGLARAIAFFKAAKARPGALVLSGGDMLNRGSPTWSDEYRCLEWPWLDGLVDAMAVGNHDLDYGPEEFGRCRGSVAYPILSANLVREDGTPYLAPGGKPYLVKQTAGRRIGLLALAGEDTQRLIRKEALPPGTRFVGTTETARALVRELREVEQADAVVLIGHSRREDDFALARAVPGIDVILGTHSHHKGGLQRIPGTATWYAAPYQYLAYVSELRLEFEGRKLARVTGGLVRLDAGMPEDPEAAARIARLQSELEARRPERFRVLGRAALELSDDGVTTGESVIANWACDLLRPAAGAHAFFTTASSFRGGIPPGDVTAEAFYAAIPYTNEIVTAEMSGAQLLEWLALSASRLGSDGFSPASGVRYVVRAGRPESVEVLRDPADASRGFAPLDPAARYRVATSDYQAYKAEGYSRLFVAAANPGRTGQDAHAVLIGALAAGPASARKDGRVRVESR